MEQQTLTDFETLRSLIKLKHEKDIVQERENLKIYRELHRRLGKSVKYMITTFPSIHDASNKLPQYTKSDEFAASFVVDKDTAKNLKEVTSTAIDMLSQETSEVKFDLMGKLKVDVKRMRSEFDKMREVHRRIKDSCRIKTKMLGNISSLLEESEITSSNKVANATAESTIHTLTDFNLSNICASSPIS